MKNFVRLLGGLFLPIFLVGFLMAAQVCNKADMYCYESGPSQNLTTIGRLDASGNLTTNGTVTATGSITSVSSITATTANFSSSITVNGGLINPSVTQFSSTNFINLFSTNTLPVVATFETFTSSGGGNTLLKATPIIATTTITTANYLTGVGVNPGSNMPDGTFVILGTTSTAKFWIQDNSVLSGSGLALGSTTTTEVIDSSRPVAFIYSAATGLWNQVSKYNTGF